MEYLMLRFALAANLLLLLMSLAALAMGGGTALAHERREVDKYLLVVGFIGEPAFEGLKNGVDLRVTNRETTQPVTGLETTLQVEITHIASNTAKTFPIRSIFNDPGHYTNDLIFTAPGHYKLRFFGTIEGTQVDETFESGTGRFSEMRTTADLQFPARLPEVREVEGAARGAQAAAQQAQDQLAAVRSAASAGRTLGMVGVVLGTLGLVFGLGAMRAARKR
jgi:hypothetical protein